MSNGTSNGGLNTASVVQVVFIVLKLCGVITWSWWWVMSPMWLCLAVYLVIAVLLVTWITIKKRK